MELRHFRAPREHAALAACPPLADAAQFLDANRRALAAAHLHLLGRPLVELRALARRDAAAAARAYLLRTGEPLPPEPPADAPLLVSGHQPELFHPGVWVKNFALAGLARRGHAWALNLVIDNDTVKSLSLPVPGVPVPLPDDPGPRPRRRSVPFDAGPPGQPYEEHTVRDEALFASLPDRVPVLHAPSAPPPILASFWDDVRRASRRTPLLGERFAAARRNWERSWGCHNLELPLSDLAATEAFAWFAAHLLSELPRLHAAYNAAVRDYRRHHRVKSLNHPVPDLAAVGDWLEVPLWAWRPGQSRRARLFARLSPAAINLRAGEEPWPSLPRSSPDALARALHGLGPAGCKLRPRALVTTLFTRLFLADHFLHGLGGGKYDEVTDALARSFYRLTPPAYQVVTGTLLVPLPTYPVTDADRLALGRRERHLLWSPQRHLPDARAARADLASLVREHRDWLALQPADAAQRRARGRALRRLTEALRPAVADLLADARRARTLVEHRLAANAVLLRRDYAFCLYPEAVLRPFLTALL